MEYCCEKFKKGYLNQGLIKKYSHSWRLTSHDFDTYEEILHVIDYCPFCGKKLE